MRDLTEKDVEGIEWKPDWKKIDYLAAVAGVARDMLEEEEKKGNEKQYNSEKEKKPLKKRRTEIQESDQECRLLSKKKNKNNPENDEKPMRNFSLKIKDQENQESKITKKRNRKSNQEEFGSDDDCDDEEEYQSRMIQKKRTASSEKEGRKITNHQAPIPIPIPIPNPIPPPQGLPIRFKERIIEESRGEFDNEEVLVIQKTLSQSDVNSNMGRFTIPSRHMSNKFLNEDEDVELDGYVGRYKYHIPVSLIDPSLECVVVHLRKWTMEKKESDKSSISYVLNGESSWNKVMEKNRLEIGDTMQLWAVRVGGKLWFALVRLNGHDQ
ncbi:hypothetical protein ACH5RR_037770 [Cinchona calisaya]|uniref:B3 domain-containing protein n=1 Tax=Cinchona calisaya TaxID=153742 RepID=A0ABD2Y9G9_9GENT